MIGASWLAATLGSLRSKLPKRTILRRFHLIPGERLRGHLPRFRRAALIGLGYWMVVPLLAVILLGQANPQSSAQLPADAAKPSPSVITGQPNAQQPQPPGTPPAAATKPAAAPNETSTQAPPGGGPLAKPLQQAAQQSAPSTELAVELVRSTLLAFNDANLTGNYDVLYALAAPIFQHDVDTAKLRDSFKSFRDHKLDLSAIAVLTPGFVKPPEIDKDGFLRVAGAFPSQPLQLNFSLAYQMIDGRWRYAGLAAAAEPVHVAAGGPAGGAAAAPSGQTGIAVPAANAAPASDAQRPTIPPRKRERYVRVRPGLPPATTRW
jgi:hypothetical protein